MLEFKKLELSDKDRVEPFLASDGYIMSDRTFASLFIWREHYDVQICFKDDFLYFLSKEHKDMRTYYMPLGSGDIKKAFWEIEEDSRACGMPYHVFLVTPERKAELESLCPGKYIYTEDRDNFDYIYKAEDLMELRGKKLHSKRNHINRFRMLHDGRWRYEDIDPQKHRALLHAYTLKWGATKRGDGYQDDYRHELVAIDAALSNYQALNIRGGILWLDDQVIAYTLAAVTHNKVIDVMFEKADADIDGAYPMINNQFAIHNFGDIELVNREEDMGIEGLRTAKLSYNPAFLSEKFIVTPSEAR
ncbi:MAG: phosphatidylglycerol lysyltransferase domain-containing protein [Clostridiaceae bacterium]|nr:phosphatidylglycerol lysyltransferase domain-containing protein [Clostridiaceae bacterium]